MAQNPKLVYAQDYALNQSELGGLFTGYARSDHQHSLWQYEDSLSPNSPWTGNVLFKRSNTVIAFSLDVTNAGSSEFIICNDIIGKQFYDPAAGHSFSLFRIGIEKQGSTVIEAFIQLLWSTIGPFAIRAFNTSLSLINTGRIYGSGIYTIPELPK